MGSNVLGSPPAQYGDGGMMSAPSQRSTLLSTLQDMAIAGLLSTVKRQVPPPQVPGDHGAPPNTNIGNCSGQIAKVFYVNDTPPAEGE